MAEPIQRDGPDEPEPLDRREWGEDQVIFYEGSGKWIQIDERVVVNLEEQR